MTPSSTPSSIPTGDFVNETVSTGDGCAVFLNVDPDPTLTYTVSIANSANTSPEIINASEQSYDNPSPITAEPGLGVQVGQPTLAPAFATVGNPSVAPAASIPVTVSNSPNLASYVFPTLNAGVMYLFPFASTYTAWPGDTAVSNPGSNSCATYPATAICYPTAPLATSISASSSAAASVTLPVYDLALTLSTTLPSGDQLTAADTSAPGTVYALNVPSGKSDATGMPLGQYVVGDTKGSVTAVYVWVTNAGVYYSTSGMVAPSSGTLATSGVPVTA
jgi:hypothetical protein